MTENFPRGSTAVAGVATYGIDGKHGMQPMELAGKAALMALGEAGMTPAEIDGFFIALPPTEDAMSGLWGAEYLGINPRVTSNNRVGGSSFQSMAIAAALALDAGMCDAALICYGSNQRSSTGKLITSSRPFRYESVYRPVAPASAYALAASRHMHEYGTTRRQLAEVAVAARGWANLNPEAYSQGELTIDDVLGARIVSSPLGKHDCCLVTDGAAAAVMVRADRARDLQQTPVYLLGGAEATTHRWISQMPDLTTSATAQCAPRAYAQAGVCPEDVDVVELYDAFTINTIMMLEDMGFCAKGEGGAFVEDGAIAPGGRLPVNTMGGGLSYCHPGMFGMFTLVEAVRQLRGGCGDRQVQGAEIALSHGNGGSLSHQGVLVLGGASTV